jgi:beta-lactamase class A
MKLFTRCKHSKLLKNVSLLILGLCVGIASGYFIGKSASNAVANSIKQSLSPIEEKGTSYTFVHPLLAYHTPEATVLGDYVSLNNSLQTIINSAVGSGNTARASVYFRDLDAGRWLGINQDDTYYPASLLKVPTLIAYYKEAEDDPSILSQTIAYDPSVMPTEPFTAPSELVAYQNYSVQDLIDKMIIDSDNGATFTLLARINPEFLNDIYIALGIQNPGDDSANYQISDRTYALFFRVLYNATYLSPESSEQALKLLSQTTFTNGIVAGAPKGTVIAHKYGEHVLSQNNVATGIELSDCGIIYYPAHPYLLCVMTSSKDMPTASSVIANISSATYAAVAQKYPTTPMPQ